ncbi:SDR family NAD(P)-dependent oxidoreductase [Ilumatobacter coccineus]|uniref:Putative oxidoreductase n=1 Tax=Ilumatobacter coccineus (strain NBRC 103263 / KCTC 29153 / YM16-304) TaxID=1313172 RepID=A0A6C7E5A1_ILUCY|nr:SDR family oxidoreductase [Ilumatobacter coccineus]BAN01663.1 putative oxidoreductase [Ilumatobacter coccineus YM16-304]
MADSILDRFALTDGVAVVTGAGRGIGEGIAIGLAEAGCDVVLTARRENEINAVADKVRALGRRALAIPGDITDGEFVESLAKQAKDEMGKVTLWVSNAGGADDRTPRHLADMPDRQWDYQMDLNLRAVFTGARAAAAVLEEGGSIINISSGAALKPSPNNGPYAVAKAGVDSLTRTMSSELASRGIRVNGVAPGPVPTEVFMEFFGASEEDIPGLGKKLGIPLGRLGRPEDVANAVVYLASDAASWVTGQTLLVNGGNR